MKEMKRRISSTSSAVPEIIEKLRIEKLIPGGDGLARYNGKVIFIPGVLPDEIADVEITSEKKSFSRGRCLKLHSRSPERTEPVCPLYGKCGGCNMQHLQYEYQLEIKTGFLRELFQKFAKMDLPEDFEFIPSPPYGYRQRIQIHSDKKSLGFKGRFSDRIVSINHCPILVDSLNNCLPHLKPSDLPGRMILFGTDEKVYQENDGQIIPFYLKNREISFEAGMFFQSNASLLPKLLEFILEDQIGVNAMDLYCGVGFFSAFLKDHFDHITAIEINKDVEPFYHRNMSGASYDFFGMSLEEWLKKGLQKKTAEMDMILVDPPRTGLSGPVREFLIRHPVPSLVYVSCDPATQARDTAEFLKQGYRIHSMKGFDFYPQSNHMETVIKFSR